MQYMLLVYDDPNEWRTSPRSEMPAIYEEYAAVSQRQGDEARRAAPAAPRRRRPCASRTARRSSPTGRSPRRRRCSAATTSSRPTRSTTRAELAREDPVCAARRLGRGAPGRGDVAMQYMLLIYGEEGAWERARTPSARRSTRSTRSSAATCARGTSCSPARSCSRSRRRRPCRCGTATLVTDGPFAETKEALGGFYLIEADSLDEAIEWAGASRLRATARSRYVLSSTTRGTAHRRPRPCLPR